MFYRRWALLPFVSIFLAAAAVYVFSEPPSRQFNSLDDLRIWCKSKGYSVFPDSGPSVAIGCTPERVRDNPISTNPSTWKGLAVGYSLKYGLASSVPPGLAESRWGDVAIYGCPQLIAELDALR
jgi:hypothetical protein